MSEAAQMLGVHRQTLLLWIRKEWIKPKRDFRNWPVFTDEYIARVKKWRETLKGSTFP